MSAQRKERARNRNDSWLPLSGGALGLESGKERIQNTNDDAVRQSSSAVALDRTHVQCHPVPRDVATCADFLPQEIALASP